MKNSGLKLITSAILVLAGSLTYSISLLVIATQKGLVHHGTSVGGVILAIGAIMFCVEYITSFKSGKAD